MKASTCSTLSRKSSLSDLSKTTANDVDLTITETHHYHHHQHKNSDATQADTVCIPMDSFQDTKDLLQPPTESISICSLTPHPKDDDKDSGLDCSSIKEKEIQDENDLGPICTWADLPLWMQDNPAIMTGYRRPTHSHRKSLLSLGYLHNESVNIWSHLLGAVAFVILVPISYFKIIGVYDTIRWTDVAVLYAFMAGAIICLSMSASFHTFSCHSENVCGHWNRCDYVGIVFLLIGSFYPAIFYGFYCHKTWQIMYISLISVFGAATIIAVMQPRFRSPQFRWVRSGLFLGMGLSGLFPIIHGIVLYGFRMAQQAIALNYIFSMGASYVIGALIYGSRFPECLFPGKFDHFGSSHQIFHIFVLLGCAIHFVGVTQAMAFWHGVNDSCAIPLGQIQSLFVN